MQELNNKGLVLFQHPEYLGMHVEPNNLPLVKYINKEMLSQLEESLHNPPALPNHCY